MKLWRSWRAVNPAQKWGVAAVAALIAAVTAAAGGIGWAYSLLYLAGLAPGLPIGWALFGRRHPGGWLAGALVGYSLTAVAMCIPLVMGSRAWWAFVASWAAVTALSVIGLRKISTPVIRLPVWRPTATIGLAGVLLLTSLLVSVPYARIGEEDPSRQTRYRAYFTADFVWHEALTAELAKGDMPPRNPYRAAEPLAYYWTYFMMPAATAASFASPGPPVPIDAFLKVNAIWTAHLFIGVIFLTAWVMVPRGRVAAAATALTLMAPSVEGLYAAGRFLAQTGSLAPLRELNVDAVTMWWFSGMTIDGLARSIWYNPQHSLAVALGLIALTAASRFRGAHAWGVGGIAGVCLGLALLMSPFPAGAMTIIVAGTFGWQLMMAPAAWRAHAIVALAAGVPLAAGLWACLASGMVAGAGGAVVLGLSERAMTSPLTVLSLAVGPLLLGGLAGFATALWSGRLTHVRAGVVGMTVALGLYFFVTLELEPVWIGWRAGQVLLATAPGVVAWGLLTMRRTCPRWVLGVTIALWAVVGVPTTAIDWYNAQDTSNVEVGPGFRWTVVVTPAERAAFDWIQRRTPTDAVVQFAPGPRGRETWSLIPSFARRRMAAGLPISLLVTDEVRAAAAGMDDLFREPDADVAWQRARDAGIDFLFVGRVEREAFPGVDARFGLRPDLFLKVFANRDVAVYALQ